MTAPAPASPVPTAEPEAEDLTGFDVDPEQDGDGDTGDNFAKLRTSRDQWRARAEAAEAQALRGVLVESGFDPESGEGKLLLQAMTTGEVERDPEAVATYAEESYSWRPNVLVYSRDEIAQIAGADRQARLSQMSTSAQTGDLKSDYDTRIQEARDRGDFTTASALQIEYERRSRVSRS